MQGIIFGIFLLFLFTEPMSWYLLGFSFAVKNTAQMDPYVLLHNSTVA